MEVAVCSDIHLDLLPHSAVMEFGEELKESGVGAVLIAGDISSGERLKIDLAMLGAALNPVPIYYVLGNHDFWDVEITGTRYQMSNLYECFANLFYLNSCGPSLQLSPTVGIIGHDGWYDFGYGGMPHGLRSVIQMHDWRATRDFSETLNPIEDICKELARESAEFILKQGRYAAKQKDIEKVVVVTHVPPFEEACRHQGKPSEPHALPVFSSRIMGGALLTLAGEFPNIQWEVFAGHTHGFADVQPRSNLRVRVQECEYFKPTYQIIEL